MESIVLPAEWHHQCCVQLTWPHKNTDFASRYDEAVACFVRLAQEISARTSLIIVCAHAHEVREQLQEHINNAITFYEIPSNDVWARDHGGISVFKHGTVYLHDFQFNGWGQKFPADLDTRITKQLMQQNAFPHAEYIDCNDFVLEGGAIESNGNGVLLTTSRCLLEKHRNPHLSRMQIEERLCAYFGVHTILWLNHGYLAGDDTDGHIDTLARFVNEHTIMYVQCTDIHDEHYEELHAMEQELQSFRTQNNSPFTLVALPMAEAVYEQGQRLPATYANFLICNDAVLVPLYNTEKDAVALQVFKSVFPDYEIVGIDCSVLISQHGSLHCVTMQYPEITF